jgi:hypothetical protein
MPDPEDITDPWHVRQLDDPMLVGEASRLRGELERMPAGSEWLTWQLAAINDEIGRRAAARWRNG